MAKKRNNKKKRNTIGRISNNAVKLRTEDWDKQNGRVAFYYACGKNCQLSDWHNTELKELIRCFKKIENLTWNDIKTHNGLNYEPISSLAIEPPANIPPDASFSSLRVSKESRLYGFRLEDTFYIIWFDKNHIVCPKGKTKHYKI